MLALYSRLRSFQAVFAVACLLASASRDAEGQCADNRFEASDGTEFAEFGEAVAIEGSTLLVGAPGDDSQGAASGAAYVFDASTGAELTKLLPSGGRAGDRFGFSVALESGLAVVGSYLADDGGANSGVVHVFDAATGAELHRLVPDDLASGDQFGWAIDVSGSIAVVGALREDTFGPNTGAAYLFDVNTGQELAKLLPPDGKGGSNFAYSVSIHGSRVLVGAPFDSDGGLSIGTAHLFDVSTGMELAEFIPGDGGFGDLFGAAVALDESYALVGSPIHSVGFFPTGATYVFDLNTHQQLHKILPTDLGDRLFGSALELSGGVAFIGAPGTTDGSAYLYDPVSGEGLDLLQSSEGLSLDRFGASVSVDGSVFAVGVPGDLLGGGEVTPGAAETFQLDCFVAAGLSATPLSGPAELSVQFFDESEADPAVSSWAWDFGDGGSSFEQHPTHVYLEPGTYDVTLSVSNGMGSDTLTVVDLVTVELGPAGVEVNNGSGLNPLVFESSVNPILGTTWVSTVDGGAAGSSGGLTFVFGYEDSLEPGLLLGVGELLVDTTSPFALLNISVLSSGVATHAEAIPDDISLVGTELSTQAFLNQTQAGVGQLTNALILRFNTF